MNSVFIIKQLTSVEWQGLLPLITLAVTGLATLLTSTIKGEKGYSITFFTFLTGLALAALSFLRMDLSQSLSILNGVIFIDGHSQFFAVSMIVGTMLIAMVEQTTNLRERLATEIYALFSFCLIGAIILCSSTDLMMLFIAMELMTFSVYVMVAMNRTIKNSAEASVKYFILGSIASAISLYGITFIFGHTGSFNLTSVGQILSMQKEFDQIFSFGLLFLFVGILFKVGSAPFHVWVPDVYTGAANTVTSFMMAIIKFASFAFLMRVFMSIGHTEIFQYNAKLYFIFFAGTLLSLLGGNFVGLLQNNLKRLLSYSSIGHTGFILLAVTSMGMSNNPNIGQVMMSYLIYYMTATIGIMAVLHILMHGNAHSYEMDVFNGLYKREPFLAVAMAIFLLSYAGFPPLAGFFGKYYVIVAALQAQEYLLVITAVLSSIVGMAMYIKPMAHIFFHDVAPGQAKIERNSSFLVVGICLVMTFILPYLFQIM